MDKYEIVKNQTERCPAPTDFIHQADGNGRDSFISASLVYVTKYGKSNDYTKEEIKELFGLRFDLANIRNTFDTKKKIATSEELSQLEINYDTETSIISKRIAELKSTKDAREQ